MAINVKQRSTLGFRPFLSAMNTRSSTRSNLRHSCSKEVRTNPCYYYATIQYIYIKNKFMLWNIFAVEAFKAWQFAKRIFQKNLWFIIVACLANGTRGGLGHFCYINIYSFQDLNTEPFDLHSIKVTWTLSNGSIENRNCTLNIGVTLNKANES